MSEGAEVLSVQTQRGQLYIWALIDPSKPQVPRIFHVYGTGNPVPSREGAKRFIGTFQVLDGQFVGHLFEEK